MHLPSHGCIRIYLVNSTDHTHTHTHTHTHIARTHFDIGTGTVGLPSHQALVGGGLCFCHTFFRGGLNTPWGEGGLNSGVWEGVLFFVSQVVFLLDFYDIGLTNCNLKLQVCHAMLCSVVVCCRLVRCKVVSCGVVCCGVLRSAVVCDLRWCAVLAGGVVCCGHMTCLVVCCVAMWCGRVSCGVVWCHVVWCGVVWWGIVR